MSYKPYSWVFIIRVTNVEIKKEDLVAGDTRDKVGQTTQESSSSISIETAIEESMLLVFSGFFLTQLTIRRGVLVPDNSVHTVLCWEKLVDQSP